MWVVREAPKKSSIASVEGWEGLDGRSEVWVNAREGRARGVVVYVPVIWTGCDWDWDSMSEGRTCRQFPKTVRMEENAIADGLMG